MISINAKALLIQLSGKDFHREFDNIYSMREDEISQVLKRESLNTANWFLFDDHFSQFKSTTEFLEISTSIYSPEKSVFS